jgi:hypothetical protein
MAIETFMLSVVVADCHYPEFLIFYCYAERHYADCRYSECRYAECRGAATSLEKEADDKPSNV